MNGARVPAVVEYYELGSSFGLVIFYVYEMRDIVVLYRHIWRKILFAVIIIVFGPTRSSTAAERTLGLECR
jgi:hypothetical protein